MPSIRGTVGVYIQKVSIKPHQRHIRLRVRMTWRVRWQKRCISEHISRKIPVIQHEAECVTTVILMRGDSALITDHKIIARKRRHEHVDNLPNTTPTSIRLHGLFGGLARGSDGFLERLFVDGHLDSDVGEVVVDVGIGSRFDGRVVFRVLVVLSDGSDGLGKDTEEVHVEELEVASAAISSNNKRRTYQGDAGNEGHGSNERKPSCISKLFKQSTETIASQEQGQTGTNGIIGRRKRAGKPLGALLCLFSISITLLLDLLPLSTLFAASAPLSSNTLCSLVAPFWPSSFGGAAKGFFSEFASIPCRNTRPTRQDPSSTSERRCRRGEELFTETPDE
jgi:hypothetical protein